MGLTDHLQTSQVYEWNGKDFIPFQSFDKKGGRVFYHFTAQGENYLALANIDYPSKLYRWNGSQFQLVQELSGKGGRNFLHFKARGKDYLLRINHITGKKDDPKTVLSSPIYELKAGKFVEIDTFDFTADC